MTNEEAIEELKQHYRVMSQCLTKEDCLKNNEALDMAIEALNNSEIPNSSDSVPSAQPERPTEPCEFCRNHEKGNTLYESSTWDGGIGFDYIDNIKFCPICGRELQDG